MVEANADPEVVTSRIKRETRDAAAEREREAAMAVESPVMAVEGSSAAGSLAVETIPPAPPPPPVDAATAFRRGRLGVVAAIVLVLMWVWIRQRRS
jgi:hypothetical protein